MSPDPQPRLSAPALMADAATRAGTDTWGRDSAADNLERLVSAAQDTGALTPLGHKVLRSVALRHLVNRLRVHAHVDAHPDVAGRALPPAVVVTGLPRTGTTLLHNLLALDPASRVLPLWQALHPVPAGVDGTPSEAELVAQAQTWLERFYALVPGFRAVHALFPRAPEECDALLQNSFASQHFDDMFNAEAYSTWLATATLAEEYADYALQLRVLTDPSQPRRWVLKSPSHLGHLDALGAALPDLVVVHCHRHPVEAVASYASLILALRRAYSAAVSPTVVGRQALERCVTAMRRAVQTRDTGAVTVVDVAFSGLAGDPAEEVARLYARLGWRVDAGLEAAWRRWLAEHPRDRHGAHRYDPADFGLDAGAVRAAFADYVARFGPLVGEG